MWYFQIQFKSHHLLTTLLTSSPIPSCSMFSNAAPLTSRAVVAVDIPHFILADHDLDVVVSIISLKKKFQFQNNFNYSRPACRNSGNKFARRFILLTEEPKIREPKFFFRRPIARTFEYEREIRRRNNTDHRETGVSRHHGEQIIVPLIPLNTIVLR